MSSSGVPSETARLQKQGAMEPSSTGNTYGSDEYSTNDSINGTTGYSSGATTQPTIGYSNDYSTGSTNQPITRNTDGIDYQTSSSAQTGNAPPVGQLGQSVIPEEIKQQHNRNNFGGTGSSIGEKISNALDFPGMNSTAPPIQRKTGL